MEPILVGLGWKSMGLLELTALPSIDQALWQPSLLEADAILVWGGDPLYLAYWLKESGVAALLRTMAKDLVYVGVSAGAIAVSRLFAETYSNPPGGKHEALSSEILLFPDGVSRNLVIAEGVGLVEFAVLPHFENSAFPDACGTNAAFWAGQLTVPVYAIDDQSAITVVAGEADIVSGGKWQRFNAG
jgi:dipeptidase E